MTKKQKLKNAKKDKELWGDSDKDNVAKEDNSSKTHYFSQLVEDCLEQEAAILDHEPIQYCKKEKVKEKKKKKTRPSSSSNQSNYDDNTDNNTIHHESDHHDGSSSEVKKKKNKQMTNGDYLDLLESSLDAEEKISFHQKRSPYFVPASSLYTNFEVASPSSSSSSFNNVTKTTTLPKNITSLGSYYKTLTPTMEGIKKLLDELDQNFELFKVQDDLKNKQIILDKLVALTDSLSRKCFQKEDRNTIFMMGGLTFVCLLFSYFASGENESYEQIINSLSYILYRFSDHNRARSAMLTTGVFYSLWFVGGMSKNISTIAHANEVVNLLGGQLSIGYEMGNLLKRANSQLLDVTYLTTDEVIGDSYYSDSTSFPDTYLGIGTDFESLSENSFPIQLHYSIITTRTINFLSDFCVKWDSTIGEVVEDDRHSSGPGFYLMKDPNVSWYSLLKFIQLIYTDKISISKAERERVLRNNNSLFESKLVSEGFPRLLTTLRNQKTRENAINCMTILTVVDVENESNTGELFDQFDDELVKDELNYFFGKPHIPWWYTQQQQNALNVTNTFNTEFLRKREKIRQQAVLLSGLEQDLGLLYMEMMTSQCVQREENNTLLFCPDVKIELTNSLGEVDYILQEQINNYPILKNVFNCNGFYLHKCIISTRSEFMKKVLQYEVERTENGFEIVYLNNFSLSTLFTVFQYMYGGLNEEGFPLLFTENLVECFLAADMFLLFGLKKYTEQKICEQISLETVEDLYYISIIYNSDLIKDKCIEIMTNHNIAYEVDLKKLK